MSNPSLTNLRTDLDALLPRLAAEVDKASLADSERILTSLVAVPGTPSAFGVQAQRLARQALRLHDEGAEPAVRGLLVQGIEKLLRTWPEMPVDEAPLAEPVQAPAPAPPSAPSTDNPVLEAFRSAQIDRLPGFEVLCLEREKGNPGALGAIKAVLHTIKGEYGVLDMPAWSELIHCVETELEGRGLATDQLLALKDLLERHLEALMNGAGFDPAASDLLAIGVSDRETSPPPPPPPALEDPQSMDSAAPWAQDPSLLTDFVTETGEHIRVIEVSLLRLEVDPGADEALNATFRAFHTIKGLASFLKLHRIRKLSHAAETLLDQVRQKRFVLNGNHVDTLLVATDCLRSAVATLDPTGREEPSELGDMVAEGIIEKLLHPEQIEPESTLPLGVMPESAPLGQFLVQTGLAAPEAVEKALDAQSKGDSRHLGEILVAEHKVRALDVGQALNVQSRVRAAEAPPPPPPTAAPVPHATAVEDSVRVPVERLDQLIDAIGEAVIAQSTVFADPLLATGRDLALEKKMAQAALMMRQIQELSMSLRMVAIRQTFQKMGRLVRDLSRKLGKQVELEMDGEATELDKTVVENIGDPLVHMVRNSLDHGLETPAVRLAAGKSEKGRIVLRAFHKAGNVHIEIEDDGRGLDRERILGKAIAAGIVRQDQVLSDPEVWQLIFHPGLSTAEKVTDVSGRGVGMDVVKRNIEQLRGAIDIRSDAGHGTCFTIRLPLTLAIISGMTVRLAEERYIVPTLSVQSTLMPDPEAISSVVGKGRVLSLRGELIRLVDLHDVFGSAPADREGAGVALIVEDSMGRRLGLQVDEIVDQQQVVIKNLGGGVAHVPGVAGGAIMTDGTVSLILDVSGISRLVQEKEPVH